MINFCLIKEFILMNCESESVGENTESNWNRGRFRKKAMTRTEMNQIGKKVVGRSNCGLTINSNLDRDLIDLRKAINSNQQATEKGYTLVWTVIQIGKNCGQKIENCSRPVQISRKYM